MCGMQSMVERSFSTISLDFRDLNKNEPTQGWFISRSLLKIKKPPQSWENGIGFGDKELVLYLIYYSMQDLFKISS